jgi:hypothetical protein
MRPNGRPFGDFCPRPFCSALIVLAFRGLGLRAMCSSSTHRSSVAAGEPLDATSPGSGSRQPVTGGAGPSPLSNDSGAFPAGRTRRIMREVLGVGRKAENFFEGGAAAYLSLRDPSPQWAARHCPRCFRVEFASEPKPSFPFRRSIPARIVRLGGPLSDALAVPRVGTTSVFRLGKRFDRLPENDQQRVPFFLAERLVSVL